MALGLFTQVTVSGEEWKGEERRGEERREREREREREQNMRCDFHDTSYAKCDSGNEKLP